MNKSLGTLLRFRGVFRVTRTQPLLLPGPQTMLDACIQNFFQVSSLYGVGEGRNEEHFEKVALFYEGTQTLQKKTNTALLSQGRLSRIVGTVNYFSRIASFFDFLYMYQFTCFSLFGVTVVTVGVAVDVVRISMVR